MNLGTVINLAVGLIVTFATMALVVSAVKEALANALQTRSNTLRKGVMALLNDPTLTGLAGKVLQHGAINPLAPGAPGQAKDEIQKAAISRIEPNLFANALIEIVQNDAPGASIDAAIDKIEDPQIKAVLKGAFGRANDDLTRFHQEVANWFDSAMGRVGDRYRTEAQFWSFAIAMGLCIGLNVDTFAVAQAIWAMPQMVAQVPDLGKSSAEAINSFTSLVNAGFPLGWTEAQLKSLANWSAGGAWVWWVAVKLLGCSFTAFASLLGAPFWFDMLAKVRNTAAPPAPAPTPVPAK